MLEFSLPERFAAHDLITHRHPAEPAPESPKTRASGISHQPHRGQGPVVRTQYSRKDNRNAFHVFIYRNHRRSFKGISAQSRIIIELIDNKPGVYSTLCSLRILYLHVLTRQLLHWDRSMPREIDLDQIGCPVPKWNTGKAFPPLPFPNPQPAKCTHPHISTYTSTRHLEGA